MAVIDSVSLTAWVVPLLLAVGQVLGGDPFQGIVTARVFLVVV